jgi:hypothetical protein
MSKHLPPIPPASVSPKGTGGDRATDVQSEAVESSKAIKNLAEQGRQGNIKQNTTNQGYQQDR